MFDISFSELAVIGVVALVVIGPERLPRVARTVGHLLGRAQRYVGDVKADIRREIELDELKKLQNQVTDAASDFRDNFRREVDAARAAFVSPAENALADLEQTAQQAVTAHEVSPALPSAPVGETAVGSLPEPPKA